MHQFRDRLFDAVTALAKEQGRAIPAGIDPARCDGLALLAAARQAGLDPQRLNQTIAKALDLPYLEDLAQRSAAAVFVEKIPIGFARRHGLIGLSGGNGRLPVAMADLSAWGQLDVVSRFLGRQLEPSLAAPEQVTAAINLAYQQRTGQAQSLIERLDRQTVLDEVAHLGSNEDLLDVAGRAPVIKLVNLLLFEAVQQGASDIHIQPSEDALVARVRIDGVLFDAFRLAKGLQEEVISRLKVMGKMDIAEKRLPQDGRATVVVGDRLIDLRLASLPTSYGERMVIRLLDKSARLYDLGDLGMQPVTLNRFLEAIGADHGLILVTGPTGAGKTTTLYAALQELDATELNILTLEDPIEYQLPGISQTQVSDKKGLTFAGGLRHVLRQDPDIIMVGEIRDHETAAMAIQSALTGHLVLSTLHTNDAASAVTRLLDLGVEPYLVASSVVGVLAQRLVRRICPDCSALVNEDAAALEELARLGPLPTGLPLDIPSEGAQSPALGGDLERPAPGLVQTNIGISSRVNPGLNPGLNRGPNPGVLELLESRRIGATGVRAMRKGRGCAACRKTGYRGRVGLFELLTVDDRVRRKIQACATAAEIKAEAVAQGMKTLRDNGRDQVLSGVTTVEEVLRVTMRATA